MAVVVAAVAHAGPASLYLCPPSGGVLWLAVDGTLMVTVDTVDGATPVKPAAIKVGNPPTNMADVLSFVRGKTHVSFNSHPLTDGTVHIHWASVHSSAGLSMAGSRIR